MKTQSPALPSDHRLARLLAWLRLWLVWLAAHGAAAAPAPLMRRWLQETSREIAILILARALRRVAPPTPRAIRKPAPPRGVRVRVHTVSPRMLIGGALRRALGGRGVAGKVAALLAVLANAERWVEAIAARLKRRMTRWRRLVLIAAMAWPLAASAPSACAPAPDTS